MDRVLYIGMSGAKETLLSQGMNSHNLANVSTTGFRADLAQFRSMPVFGPGHPSRAYAMTEKAMVDFKAGPLQNTGRDLDVAIKGEGWIAVQAADGTEAYTRAGNLQITATGQVINGQGHPVMGNAGPVVIPPAEKVTIGVDGTITIIPLGQEANAQAVIDRIKLVNPPKDQLEKRDDGLIRMVGGQVAPADFNIKLISGMLEGSNVSVAESLVKLISLQRHFEMQVKVMKTAEQNDEATASLMRMS